MHKIRHAAVGYRYASHSDYAPHGPAVRIQVYQFKVGVKAVSQKAFSNPVLMFLPMNRI